MSTPTLDPNAPPGPAVPLDPEVDTDFFATFVRWEKYRLIYNGVLGYVSFVMFVFLPVLETPGAIFKLLATAIGLNACFCLGPVLNGYAWRAGIRGRWVGLTMMSAGTPVAAVLMAIALYGVWSSSTPNFD